MLIGRDELLLATGVTQSIGDGVRSLTVVVYDPVLRVGVLMVIVSRVLIFSQLFL